ncbi:MAG: ACP S-malonyltransferase [Isosphaerales bacterium]
MKGILADNDSEGLLEVILHIWSSNTWRDLWNDLGLSVESFLALGLSPESSDALIWRTCQEEKLVLITGNRNADGVDSLEMVIRVENQPDSLPAVTLANPKRILKDRIYAEKAAEKLLDYLTRIDDFRGAGRIYAP